MNGEVNNVLILLGRR